MPVAEFPGRFGWGYDGVDLFAPDAPLRHARRHAPLRRRGARARPRRHPRRRLQPPRARRQLPRQFSPTTSPTATRTSGATRSTSTGPTAGRCASSSSPTPATGSRSSTSTACASTRRRDLRRLSRAHPRGDHAPRARGGGRGATIIVVARTSRRTRAWSARSSAAATGLDALWNDDFHHSAMVALTGRARPTTPTTAARRRSSSRRQVRLPVTRASATPGSASGAARRPSGLPPPRVRQLPAEPRPGRQLRARAAAAPADQPGRWRAMTALLLLARHADAVPGQEFAASRRSSTSPTTSRSCLGSDLNLNPAPEPLLAPPAGKVWRRSGRARTTDTAGRGRRALETKDNWRILGARRLRSVLSKRPRRTTARDGGDGPSEEEEVRAETLRAWEEEG
jgi:maltooligosyltrehalose trehalohydrolase